MRVLSIEIKLFAEGGLSAVASLKSVIDNLSHLDGVDAQQVFEQFADLFAVSSAHEMQNLEFNALYFFEREVIDSTAGRANDVCVNIKPSSRYLELVSAVAGCSDLCEYIEERHGWPILSVVGETPSLAENGEDRQAPADGGRSA